MTADAVHRGCLDSSHSRRRGVSLTEVLMASALLASCFMLLIQHTSHSVQNTRHAGEYLIASHHLMDLLERFKGSPLTELDDFAGREEGPLALGADAEHPLIKDDRMLSGSSRIIAEMLRLRAPGKNTADYARDLNRSVLMAKQMQLTRIVTVETIRKTSVDRPGIFRLTCTVRWHSPAIQERREISLTKVLVRRSTRRPEDIVQTP